VGNIYKKILFGTDGSPHSDNIARQIVDFQKQWNCKVVIFHSIKDDKYLSMLSSNNTLLSLNYRNSEELRKEFGKEILKQTKKIFDRASISVELRLIEDEDPKNYIKRMVKEEEFDLVILGSNEHHYNSEKSFLRQRFTKILEESQSPCDVLIIR